MRFAIMILIFLKKAKMLENLHGVTLASLLCCNYTSKFSLRH